MENLPNDIEQTSINKTNLQNTQQEMKNRALPVGVSVPHKKLTDLKKNVSNCNLPTGFLKNLKTQKGISTNL